MSTLRGLVPKFRVCSRPVDLTDPAVPHSMYYDALRNSEPLTQAFKDRETLVFTTALLSVPSLYVTSTTIDNRNMMFSLKRSSAVFDASHPTSTAVLYCTVLGYVHVTFVIHAALPMISEPVYLHVFAHTVRTSSCLLASKIGKRQNSMFSDLTPRPSRTQPTCASNKFHKHRSAIGRRDNSV